MFMTFTCRSTGPARTSKWTLVYPLLFAGMLLAASLLPSSSAFSQEAPEAAEQDAAEGDKVFAQRLVVPLPIVNEVDRDVKRSVQAVLDRFEKEGAFQGEGERPILVLEFRPREGTAGESSDCLLYTSPSPRD